MNAILIAAAILAMGGQDVQTTSQPTTQLYVKTIPAGAEVTVDGTMLGKSDGLFDVTAGSHKLTLRVEGYLSEDRSVEVRDGEITRIEVELKKRSGQQVILSHVGESSDAQQSFADSGHAVAFQRPGNIKSIVAVKLFAARYGYPKPPEEDFHVYLLDQNKKVLEQIAIPYRKVERGELCWQTFEFPAIKVPENFFVAVWFNAEATKGVFLGMDKDIQETHSYVGLPDKGFQKVDKKYDWMIRAVVSSEDGKQPTHPKVTTYEEEKAADTESTEAQPVIDQRGRSLGVGSFQTKERAYNNQAAKDKFDSPPLRTWNDATGAFSLEAHFGGVEQGKVTLKKADGKTVKVPLDRLSKADQDFIKEQAGTTKKAEKPAAREARELSLDNGKMASKSSIAGGGHAVKFKVDGDSFYVTSVSLHGSRYGEPRPPKESFKVWICDAQFQPLATFQFPYSSYTRSEPGWKSFRIRPTRVPEEFIVCFGFNPQQTKGVFVSYDDKPSTTSMIGVPGESEPKPFNKGNWLIRCKVEKRDGGSGKTP